MSLSLSLTLFRNIRLSISLTCNSNGRDANTDYFRKGGGERSHSSYSQHFQRAAGVPDFVADFRHHGSADVCRQILQGELLALNEISI